MRARYVRGHVRRAIALTVVLAAAGASASAAVGAQIVSATTSPLEQIHTLVASSAGASGFGGVVDDPSTGTATEYVTPAAFQAVENAVDGAGDAPFTKLVEVPNSYATLQSLTSQITGDQSVIKAAGIDMRQWGPDPQSNTVQVEVSSDPSVAESYFDNAFGADRVTVVFDALPLPSLESSGSDTEPFAGGDYLEIPSTGGNCTSNFWYTGNNSGATYGLTAGHCEGTSVTSNGSHEELGLVSTNYYLDEPYAGNHPYDFESFTCAFSCKGGYVWTGSGGGTAKSVTQACGTACSVGDLVAMDGGQTHEVDSNTIVQQGLCVGFNEGPGDIETDCNLNEATHSSTACQLGDSGGPVFQNHGSAVWANGLMVGGNGTTCYYIPMNIVMSEVNGTLTTS